MIFDTRLPLFLGLNKLSKNINQKGGFELQYSKKIICFTPFLQSSSVCSLVMSLMLGITSYSLHGFSGLFIVFARLYSDDS